MRHGSETLRIFNVNEILAGLPLADLSRGVEQEDDADAFPMQAAFGSGGLFIGGFVGLAPWETIPIPMSFFMPSKARSRSRS